MAPHANIVEFAHLYRGTSERVEVWLMCLFCLRAFLVDQPNVQAVTRCPFCGRKPV